MKCFVQRTIQLTFVRSTMTKIRNQNSFFLISFPFYRKKGEKRSEKIVRLLYSSVEILFALLRSFSVFAIFFTLASIFCSFPPVALHISLSSCRHLIDAMPNKRKYAVIFRVNFSVISFLYSYFEIHFHLFPSIYGKCTIFFFAWIKAYSFYGIANFLTKKDISPLSCTMFLCINNI